MGSNIISKAIAVPAKTCNANCATRVRIFNKRPSFSASSSATARVAVVAKTTKAQTSTGKRKRTPQAREEKASPSGGLRTGGEETPLVSTRRLQARYAWCLTCYGAA
jgi:hypothetical protein